MHGELNHLKYINGEETMSNPPITSHGRGGNANIGPDPTKYVDSEIVRTGPQGDQGGVFLGVPVLPYGSQLCAGKGFTPS